MDKKRELLGGLKEGRARGGSMGCIEDLWKRKREEGEEEKEVFIKSRKTLRSPEGGKEDGRGEEERRKREEEKGILNWKGEMEKMMKVVVETCMGKWGEELKKVREEVREGREETREVLKELKEREERWKEDREEVRRQMKELEVRIEKLEVGREVEGEEKKGKGEGGEIERRMKEIERRMEMKEREERRKNLVIRGLEVREGKRREAAEELLKEIGVEMKIKEIWRITAEKERGREAVGIKVEEEKRGEIWEKKKKLRGRKERILEDWTWKERRMRWRLEEIAREEERRGRKSWIGYGKIKIEGQWWRWDEEEEVLKDVRGKIREVVMGEEGEGGREELG